MCQTTRGTKRQTSGIGRSVARIAPLLAGGDLSDSGVLADLLGETGGRRTLDLSDLDPAAQSELIAGRVSRMLPSREALADAIRRASGRGLTVKLGVDPTSADLHLGHAVPIALLGRFQRMGHRAVLIVGDVTARIGDPSGRTAERPALSADDVRRNMASYSQQVRPFFDLARTQLRYNSEWLEGMTLPRLIECLAGIPASTLLQREDFRQRLTGGQGLSMAELIYPVVMALDSAALNAEVELGGVDQLLNMQMGRRVMELAGQAPQLVVTVPLIEGTDGTGAKMSKSRGNAIPLTAAPSDMFGQVMSIPDRLSLPYLRAWSEWTDPEIAVLEARSLHPMVIKALVSAEIVAAVHGVPASLEARRAFEARFSRRRFDEIEGLPSVALAVHGGASLGAALTTVLGFVPSLSAARRLARQGGLRLVRGRSGTQETTVLQEGDLGRPLRDLAAGGEGDAFIKAGRQVARLLCERP
jgi:tyrosyl-tRNA synthetase